MKMAGSRKTKRAIIMHALIVRIALMSLYISGGALLGRLASAHGRERELASLLGLLHVVESVGIFDAKLLSHLAHDFPTIVDPGGDDLCDHGRDITILAVVGAFGARGGGCGIFGGAGFDDLITEQPRHLDANAGDLVFGVGHRLTQDKRVSFEDGLFDEGLCNDVGLDVMAEELLNTHQLEQAVGAGDDRGRRGFGIIIADVEVGGVDGSHGGHLFGDADGLECIGEGHVRCSCVVKLR